MPSGDAGQGAEGWFTVVKEVHMEQTMNVRGGSSTRPIRQVAAVGIGAAVAFVGGFLGVLGALGPTWGAITTAVRAPGSSRLSVGWRSWEPRRS